MGFNPTLVLNAAFDTPERKEFARRLVTGYPIEDERLKGVALPAPGVVWSHDQQRGLFRARPLCWFSLMNVGAKPSLAFSNTRR